MAYTTPIGIPQPLWGAFDPINATPPSRPGNWPSAEAANYYYIDNTHPNKTDTANTYGYPDKPRATIPQTTYAAGAYVEVHGGPYVQTSGDLDIDIVSSGTEANPVWFLFRYDGVNRAEIQGQVKVSGSYIILDGFYHTKYVAGDRMPALGVGGDTDTGNHICIRNFLADGGGEHRVQWSSYTGGTGSSGSPLEYIIFYNGEITGMGSYTYAVETAEEDYHAMHPGPYQNYTWILAMHCHLNGGDAVQVNGNNITGDARAQYVYIGDCLFETNGENAVDVKSGRDVIMSQNHFHTYGPAQGSDGAAIVVQQEGGGGSDNVWALFNTIHDARLGMRVEELCTNIYMLGNVVYNLTNSPTEPGSTEDGYCANFVVRSNSGTSVNIIDNTFYGYETNGLRLKAQGSPPIAHVHGNIFAGRVSTTGWANPTGWDMFCVGSNPTGQVINYNLYDSTNPTWYNGSNGTNGTTYTTLTGWQSGNPQGWDANSIVGNPGFINGGGYNFRLTANSAAINANVEHAAYATFSGRYGLNIKFDKNGVARASGSWEIGAYEFVNIPIGSARNYRVTPSLIRRNR